MNRVTGIALLLLLAACAKQEPVTLTGRVTDAVSGAGVGDALLTLGSGGDRHARTGRDGWYVAQHPRDGDTVTITCGGYQPRVAVLQFAADERLRMLRNYTMDPNPDTAFTAMGPVDASMFLDNDQVRRKKLSLNEARFIVQEKFPGCRVVKGSLVRVSDVEEWLFDVKLGRASAAVYIDATSGEIRSIESDDPNMDRKLQEMIGK
ncbi:MAG: hypothetical protein IPP94_16940 [Ignavibacteria bacterium]|nr:hypothetical protein [Ignavibacteria bacterium]